MLADFGVFADGCHYGVDVKDWAVIVFVFDPDFNSGDGFLLAGSGVLRKQSSLTGQGGMGPNWHLR